LLGELSYPMYVSHIPVCQLLVKFAPAQVEDGNLLYVTCVVAVSSRSRFRWTGFAKALARGYLQLIRR